MVTLGIALLLASGFLVAKICQRFRLPSVTGYILAGVFLGPSGINIINRQSIGSNLDHFTSIALMLISFGIGEHVELKKLQDQFRTVAWIAACEAIGAFIFVFAAVFLTIHFTGIEVDGWQLKNYIALSLLLAAVGLATAPAATLLVTRELKASGPFTASLLAIVAIEVQGYNSEQTKKFAKDKNINYIVLSEEKASDVVGYIQQRAQWRGSIPFLVALDTKGDVQFVQAGMLPEASLEELIKKLSKK